MNKQQHRQDILSISRFLVIMIIILSMINLIAVFRLDIDGMNYFLMWFNGVVFVSLAIFVTWLDYKRYEIIRGNKK